MTRRLNDLARGLGSLVSIAALLAGVPWALTRYVGNPLPSTLPSLDRISAALSAGRIDPQVVIDLLTVLVWLVWAQLALGLVVEAAAALRGHTAPRLPVLPGAQRLAGQLVASATLLLSTFLPGRPVLAAELSTLVATPTALVAVDPALTVVDDDASTVAGTPTAEVGPVHTVQRGDTLWSIAERTLGNGTEWKRIRDLNVGRVQPDGTRLGEDFVEDLRPGWTLALPDGAVPGPTSGHTYTVGAGDSLSSIAEAAYGDERRYTEVFAENEGRPQPDGRTLADPDVIHPGWQLDLPATPAGAVDVAVPAPLPPAPDAVEEADTLLPDEQAAPEPSTEAPPEVAVPPAPTDSPTATGPLWTPSPATPRADEPTPETSGATSPATSPDDGDAEVPVAPAAIGAGALVAASLLWTLARLRARQSRRRRPGRDLPEPSPELVDAERRLRSAAADAPVAWVDATLRLLTVRLRERADRQMPAPPLAFRAGEDGVEVLLSQPDTDPPPGFQGADEGYSWRLDSELTLAGLQQAVGDAPPIAPATVTLGHTPEGPLLVNLEALALLRVQGPSESAQAFLSGMAVELTTAPWASSVTVHPVVAGDDPLIRLPGAEAATTLGDLAPRLTALAEATRGAVANHDDTHTARTAPDGDDWPPTVVVLREPGDESATLEEVVGAARQPGSGLALVVAGDVEDATWRLLLSDDGTATLEPLGLQVQVAGLDLATASAAADLLDLATAEDIGRPEPAIDIELDDATSETEEARDGEVDLLGSLPVEVAVLGPVTVTGWDSPEVRPQSVELVAYLAVQGRPVPTDTVRTALWPDGINYNTFKNVVSRTRHALGLDGTGTFHLPESRGGRYRLGPEVGCDWARFQALLATARGADPTEEASLLQAALELVTGRPFDATTAGTYQWAYDEQTVSAIEVAVVDAADRLATLALDADDPNLAVWATRQGHLVVPDHEGLYRARMRAHALTSDLDAIHQTYREALRAARAYDPLDDLQPETEQLYEDLTRSSQAADRVSP